MIDCTILLQGRVNSECLNLWIKNYSEYKVVLSVWEDEDLSLYAIPNNWKVVINQYPLLRFRPEANLDYQIITTLKGLQFVNTNWVIKVRADEYWSNIEVVYKKMQKFSDKIITGSMFFRKWGLYKFHCSDKILGGSYENILSMFESTLHNIQIGLWDTNIPESQLGLGFVMAKEKNFEVQNERLKEQIQSKIFSAEETSKKISQTMESIVKTTMNVATNEFRIYKNESPDWASIKNKFSKLKLMIDDCINDLDFENIKPINDKPYMQKWFEIIDINKLKPYIATRYEPTVGRIWYRSDFDHKAQNCITKI